MNRAQYEARRRQLRDAWGKREDHGLPHHPDGSGWAPCIECKGTGTWFHPRGPSGEFDEPCDACGGNGVIPDGHRDALLIMHDTRKWRFLSSSGPLYSAAHTVAVRPALGMAQLRMVEAAIGCDVTTRSLLTSMRRAA